MENFNIIDYIGGLTAYVFDKSVIEAIALDRGVSNVTMYEELTTKQKDLLYADLLYVAYTSPSSIGSVTTQHGSYTTTIGAQTTNSKLQIYNVMVAIYRKYGDDKLEFIPNPDGGLFWMD